MELVAAHEQNLPALVASLLEHYGLSLNHIVCGMYEGDTSARVADVTQVQQEGSSSASVSAVGQAQRELHSGPPPVRGLRCSHPCPICLGRNKRTKRVEEELWS